MDFSKRERMLDVISSEISNSKNNLNKLINKKEKNDNAFVNEVNKKLIKYQKNILQEKILQLEHIDMLYDYLDKNMKKGKQSNIVFQQKQLDKHRKKLKKEIKKYFEYI
tara:strand:+ start:66 stop:392 length:327 start_codon:yes stop_codon:yes gene_type:complete